MVKQSVKIENLFTLKNGFYLYQLSIKLGFFLIFTNLLILRENLTLISSQDKVLNYSLTRVRIVDFFQLVVLKKEFIVKNPKY